ncbi:MAG: tetratricopeptide repeat protein [Rhizomicrobium sp.]
MNTLCIAGLLLLVVGASAWADGIDDFNQGLAAGNHGDNDEAISLLSRALSEGSLAPDLQATALVDRGAAYLRQGKYAQAAADYGAAVRLKPQYFDALAGRAQAFAATGNKADALTDCQTLTKRWPNDASSYTICGRLDWEMGNYSEAATNLETALEFNPRNPYAFLWLCLAVFHSNSEPKSHLHQLAGAVDAEDWPSPLIDLYLGDGSFESAQRAARDDPTNRNRPCELGFYGGEWQLLQGNAAAGRALLKQAADLCPETYIETEPARSELRRLGDGAIQ